MDSSLISDVGPLAIKLNRYWNTKQSGEVLEKYEKQVLK